MAHEQTSGSQSAAVSSQSAAVASAPGIWEPLPTITIPGPLHVGDMMRVMKAGSSYDGRGGIVEEETFVDRGVSYAAVRHADGRVREYGIDCLVRDDWLPPKRAKTMPQSGG